MVPLKVLVFLVMFGFIQTSSTSDFRRSNVLSLQEQPKVFKCCNHDMIFDVENSQCIKDFHNVIKDHEMKIPASSSSSPGSTRILSVNVIGFGLPKLAFDSLHRPVINRPDRNDTNYTLILERDHVFLHLTEEDFTVKQEYCFDRAVTKSGFYLGTAAVISQLKPEIECRSRPCLRSCCPKGLVLRNRKTCSKPLGGGGDKAVWVPRLVSRLNHEISNIIQDYKYFYGFPKCRGSQIYDLGAKEFFFEEDGGLNLNGTKFNYTQYCVATIDKNGTVAQEQASESIIRLKFNLRSINCFLPVFWFAYSRRIKLSVGKLIPNTPSFVSFSVLQGGPCLRDPLFGHGS